MFTYKTYIYIQTIYVNIYIYTYMYTYVCSIYIYIYICIFHTIYIYIDTYILCLHNVTHTHTRRIYIYTQYHEVIYSLCFGQRLWSWTILWIPVILCAWNGPRSPREPESPSPALVVVEK